MFDPLHKWLGIPASEQPPNHYRLLGIAQFEADSEVIDAAADKQLAFLHEMTNGEHAEAAEQLSNQISAARLCLLNPTKRRAYDDSLRQPRDNPTPAAVSPISIEPSPEMAPILNRAPVVPTVSVHKPRPRAAEKKRGSGLSYWHYSAFLCLLALVLIGIGVKRGKLTLGFSRLESLGVDVASQKPETPPSPKTEPGASTGRRTAPQPIPKPPENAMVQPSTPPSTSADIPAATFADASQSTPPPTRSGTLADLLHSNSNATDTPPIIRSPLPSATALDAKMTLVRELYEEKYRQANTSAEKIELGKLMHRDGQESSEDSVGRFAPWRVARDIFMREGDFVAALGIVDNLSTHYQDVDSCALKVESLRDCATRVTTSQLTDYVDAVIRVINTCRQQEKFDLALSLCEFCREQLGSRLTSGKLSDLEQTESETRAVEQSYRQYLTALENIEQGRDVPASNQAVGDYLCFLRGQWNEGLQYLALATPGIAQAAAAHELIVENAGSQGSAATAVVVADAWYDVAQQEDRTRAKMNTLRHSLAWYRLATDQTSGLEGKKVERRIDELQSLLDKDLAPADSTSPGGSGASALVDYRIRTSPESRSDFAERKGNDIKIGMGARPDGRGEAQVGFELAGVEKLTVVGAASHQQMVEVDAFSKTGFVVDYHTPGGYSKRVFLGLGLQPGREFTESPPWGAAKPPDMTTDIGKSDSYEIDLRRWAPPTWDGRCWFTLTMQNAGTNRSLTATLSWDEDSSNR